MLVTWAAQREGSEAERVVSGGAGGKSGSASLPPLHAPARTLTTSSDATDTDNDGQTALANHRLTATPTLSTISTASSTWPNPKLILDWQASTFLPMQGRYLPFHAYQSSPHHHQLSTTELASVLLHPLSRRSCKRCNSGECPWPWQPGRLHQLASEPQ